MPSAAGIACTASAGLASRTLPSSRRRLRRGPLPPIIAPIIAPRPPPCIAAIETPLPVSALTQ